MKLGIFSILAIIFVVAKLLHVIDWSWWLVLLPIAIPVAFVLLVLVLAADAATPR